jgi:hypothetical protein
MSEQTTTHQMLLNAIINTIDSKVSDKDWMSKNTIYTSVNDAYVEIEINFGGPIFLSKEAAEELLEIYSKIPSFTNPILSCRRNVEGDIDDGLVMRLQLTDAANVNKVDFTKPIELVHYPDIEIEFIEELSGWFISYREKKNPAVTRWCPMIAVKNIDTRELYVILNCVNDKILKSFSNYSGVSDFQFIIPSNASDVKLFEKAEVDKMIAYLNDNRNTVLNIEPIRNTCESFRKLDILRVLQRCYNSAALRAKDEIKILEDRINHFWN